MTYGETVQVLTAGTIEDPYSGETQPDWTNPTSVVVEGVAVASGGSTEPLQDARNAVEADYDLFFPADAVVTRLNKVVVRGDVCDVVGKPFLWRSPFSGWTPGLFVQAKFTDG